MHPQFARRAAAAGFALGTAALLGAPLAAQQSRNVTLLGRLDPGSSYNDIWGYVAPNGKEYALLGAFDGTYVIDCTEPTQPTLRGFFSGAAACCRDIRTYGHYAYVVNEGGGGLQILDLSNPDAPRLVKNWSTPDLWTAHNVSIDTQTGTLYAAGANGMPIVDLSQDPENPRQIGNYSNAYVHDVQVQDGIAHMAQIFSNRYVIADATALSSLSLLGSLNVVLAHNAWPSRDNRISVTTSETSGGNLTVVDISNVRLPQQIATWRTGLSTTTPHNAYLYDRVAHIAWYSEGYHAVDLSNPAAPVEIGWYDTSSSISGQNGAWGCYPFQPSGRVYISDMSNGLFVLDPLGRPALYGRGTAGQGGVPQAHTFGAAYHRNIHFKLQLEGARPQSAALLVLGIARGSATVHGATVLVDVSSPFLAVAVQTDASGRAEIAVPVPAGPIGQLHCQWLIADAGAPGGVAATRGMSFDVFAR